MTFSPLLDILISWQTFCYLKIPAKCPAVLELSARHFKIVPDMSSMFDIFDNYIEHAEGTLPGYIMAYPNG